MTENEITMLMLQLADMGVRGIKVHYDGSGDSGAIEEIVYTTTEYETPEDIEDHVEVYGVDAQSLGDLDSGIYSKVQDFAYDILNDIEDWWNNEGGFGNLCIMIPSGKYIINNNVRITDVESYFHDGNLLDKRSDV